MPLKIIPARGKMAWNPRKNSPAAAAAAAGVGRRTVYERPNRDPEFALAEALTPRPRR